MENFRPARQPVMWGAITAFILSGLTMAVAVGWLDLDPSQMTAVETFVMAGVGLAAILVPMWFASRKVTPVSAPHTADGQPAQLVALDPK